MSRKNEELIDELLEAYRTGNGARARQLHAEVLEKLNNADRTRVAIANLKEVRSSMGLAEKEQ